MSMVEEMNLLDMPPEIRMMIIDKMEPADRCRFANCSVLCNIDTKNSRNYMNMLNITIVGTVKISIAHNNSPSSIDYTMLFENSSLDGNHINCVDRNGRLLWKTKLDTSMNITLYGGLIFKKLLKKYQHSIKTLSITANFGNFDFEIHDLSRLEQLMVYGDIDIRQFLSKIRHPLKTLKIVKADSIADIAEHIIQVSEELILPSNLILSNELFLQLYSRNVLMSIGNLTEIDIYTFINSWQHGTLGKRVEKYVWVLKSSNFDIRKLVELLGVPDHDLSKEDLEIQHYTDVGKMAKLVCCFFEDALQNEVLEFREEINYDNSVGIIDNNMN